MGGTPAAFARRIHAARQANQPFDMLEHCHRIGLGGIQGGLPSTGRVEIRRFREKLEAYGMYFVGTAALPRGRTDVPAYDAQVSAHREAGAAAMHVALGGRRYEAHATLADFRKHREQCQESVRLAEPVLRKHRIRLAIENHKDWRFAEHLAWLQRVSSQWIGACVDTGNNIALCDDPMELVKAYGPYAITAHLKDMAVQPYTDGFLLSEVPFGEGVIDLPKTVDVLRRGNPRITFSLEMITRDPLRIAVFTDQYWATFADDYSPLPGRDLARTLTLVQTKGSKTAMPRISGRSLEEQVQMEDENNRKCVDYARQHLDL
jgi:sugar phosphate isomerase/epimerase